MIILIVSALVIGSCSQINNKNLFLAATFISSCGSIP